MMLKTPGMRWREKTRRTKISCGIVVAARLLLLTGMLLLFGDHIRKKTQEYMHEHWPFCCCCLQLQAAAVMCFSVTNSWVIINNNCDGWRCLVFQMPTCLLPRALVTSGRCSMGHTASIVLLSSPCSFTLSFPSCVHIYFRAGLLH